MPWQAIAQWAKANPAISGQKRYFVQGALLSTVSKTIYVEVGSDATVDGGAAFGAKGKVYATDKSTQTSNFAFIGTDAPKHFSQERTKGCDLCILLVAFRRGHIPEGETLSITQLEYSASVKMGVDILPFCLHEQAPWPRRFDELDKDPQIRSWRHELTEKHGVKFFENQNELSILITIALNRWLLEKLQNTQIQEGSIYRQETPDLIQEINNLIENAFFGSSNDLHILHNDRNISKNYGSKRLYIEKVGITRPTISKYSSDRK